MLAEVDGQFVPMPINRTTINRLYGLELRSDAQAQAFLDRVAEPCEAPRTSRDAVVAQVGVHLYELLFRDYTRKQWALDPSQLDAAVCGRLPVRTNADDRYFTDEFQRMPRDGLHGDVRAHARPSADRGAHGRRPRRGGRAAARSHARLDRPDRRVLRRPARRTALPQPRVSPSDPRAARRLRQPVGRSTTPGAEFEYTRVTEFRHLTGEAGTHTTIAYEYPCADGDPYYPIPRPENRALYERYRALGAQPSATSCSSGGSPATST